MFFLLVLNVCSHASAANQSFLNRAKVEATVNTCGHHARSRCSHRHPDLLCASSALCLTLCLLKHVFAAFKTDPIMPRSSASKCSLVFFKQEVPYLSTFAACAARRNNSEMSWRPPVHPVCSAPIAKANLALELLRYHSLRDGPAGISNTACICDPPHAGSQGLSTWCILLSRFAECQCDRWFSIPASSSTMTCLPKSPVQPRRHVSVLVFPNVLGKSKLCLSSHSMNLCSNLRSKFQCCAEMPLFS